MDDQSNNQNNYVTIPLNFDPNFPTVNGHVYDPELFYREIKNAILSGKLMVTTDPLPMTTLMTNNLIGCVKDYNGLDNTFDIIPLLDNRSKFEEGMFVSISGYGKIETKDDIKHVRNFKLSHLYLTYDKVEG